MAVKGMSLKRFYFVVILLSCNCFFLSCEGVCKELKDFFGIGKDDTTHENIINNPNMVSAGNIEMDKGDTTQTKIDTNMGSQTGNIGMGNTTENIINNTNMVSSTDESEDISDGEEPEIYKYLFLSAVNFSVGKTNIVYVATGQDFDENYEATLSVDFCSAMVKVNDTTTVKIHLWDTASQEKFKPIVLAYYENSKAVIFVYAINDRNSLKSLGDTIKEVREKISNKNTPFFLLGNKLDLAETDEAKRQVTIDEAQKFATQNGLTFLGECSAKTGAYNAASKNLDYRDLYELQQSENTNDNDLIFLGECSAKTGKYKAASEDLDYRDLYELQQSENTNDNKSELVNILIDITHNIYNKKSMSA